MTGSTKMATARCYGNVHKDRFKGNRAANWNVGQTTGRIGNQPRLPVKHVFLYPLNRKFRSMMAEILLRWVH